MRFTFIPLILLFSSCDYGYHAPDNADSAFTEDANKQERYSHCENKPGGPQQKDVDWKFEGESSKAEITFCGTWKSITSENILNTGTVAMSLDTPRTVRGFNDEVNAAVDAFKKNKRMNTNALWIELYGAHSGFLRSCYVENGKIGLMDNIDSFTGQKQICGDRFDWSLSADTIHIRFEHCMHYLLPVKDTMLDVRVRYWNLIIDNGKIGRDGQAEFTVHDNFPEYDFTSARKYKFSFSGKLEFGEEQGDYRSVIMD